MGTEHNLKLFMETSKIAFDNNYEFMMNTFEQNNFLLYTFLKQSTDIPTEVRSAIDDWLQGYIAGFEKFKQTADDGYQTVDRIMSTAGE